MNERSAWGPVFEDEAATRCHAFAYRRQHPAAVRDRNVVKYVTQDHRSKAFGEVAATSSADFCANVTRGFFGRNRRPILALMSIAVIEASEYLAASRSVTAPSPHPTSSIRCGRGTHTIICVAKWSRSTNVRR